MIKLMQTIVELEERIKKLEELMIGGYGAQDQTPQDEIRQLIYSSHEYGISHKHILISSIAQKNNLKAKDIQEIIKKLIDGCCIISKNLKINGSRKHSKVYFPRKFSR